MAFTGRDVFGVICIQEEVFDWTDFRDDLAGHTLA